MTDAESLTQQAELILSDDLDYEVRKANALIESRYRLTVEEQKLLSLGASQIVPDATDFDTLHFAVGDIVRVFNKRNKNIYQQLTEVTDRLMKRVFEVRRSDGDWEKYNWVNHVKLKNGVLSLEFSPQVKPFLLNLKENYTKYELFQIADMSSTFAIRLFEHCKQYYGLGRRSFALDREYNPKNWKLLVDAMGYEGRSYERYSHVKQKVIVVAHEQVANCDDFQDFKYREIKRGRRIIGIEFTWRVKSGRYIAVENNPVIETLRSQGVDLPVAKLLTRDYSDEHIAANIQYVLKKKQDGAPEKIGAGYFVKAIKKNYADFKTVNAADTHTAGSSRTEELDSLAAGYDGVMRDFVLEVVKKADQGTVNTFIRHQFRNPHIQQLFEEYKSV